MKYLFLYILYHLFILLPFISSNSSSSSSSSSSSYIISHSVTDCSGHGTLTYDELNEPYCKCDNYWTGESDIVNRANIDCSINIIAVRVLFSLGALASLCAFTVSGFKLYELNTQNNTINPALIKTPLANESKQIQSKNTNNNANINNKVTPGERSKLQHKGVPEPSKSGVSHNSSLGIDENSENDSEPEAVPIKQKSQSVIPKSSISRPDEGKNHSDSNKATPKVPIQVIVDSPNAKLNQTPVYRRRNSLSVVPLNTSTPRGIYGNNPTNNNKSYQEFIRNKSSEPSLKNCFQLGSFIWFRISNLFNRMSLAYVLLSLIGSSFTFAFSIIRLTTNSLLSTNLGLSIIYVISFFCFLNGSYIFLFNHIRLSFQMLGLRGATRVNLGKNVLWLRRLMISASILTSGSQLLLIVAIYYQEYSQQIAIVWWLTMSFNTILSFFAAVSYGSSVNSLMNISAITLNAQQQLDRITVLKRINILKRSSAISGIISGIICSLFALWPYLNLRSTYGIGCLAILACISCTVRVWSLTNNVNDFKSNNTPSSRLHRNINKIVSKIASKNQSKLSIIKSSEANLKFQKQYNDLKMDSKNNTAIKIENATSTTTNNNPASTLTSPLPPVQLLGKRLHTEPAVNVLRAIKANKLKGANSHQLNNSNDFNIDAAATANFISAEAVADIGNENEIKQYNNDFTITNINRSMSPDIAGNINFNEMATHNLQINATPTINYTTITTVANNDNISPNHYNEPVSVTIREMNNEDGTSRPSPDQLLTPATNYHNINQNSSMISSLSETPENSSPTLSFLHLNNNINNNINYTPSLVQRNIDTANWNVY